MKKIFLILSLLLTGLYAVVPAQQKQVLQAFYNKTDGANWTDNSRWNNGDPCLNQWHGITCNDEDTTILSLMFGDNNLVGEIPTELEYLPDLEILAFAINGLSGEIPKEIGNISKLKSLLLLEDLNGTIPKELGDLFDLQTLFIYSTNITGEIPVEIGNDTNLTELIISSEKLGGTLPSEIGNLDKLTTLAIGGKNISGQIPTTFSQLSQLEVFTIYDTKVTGNIPDWIGSLTYLKKLTLANSKFTGDIEDLIAELFLGSDIVELINLSGNGFSGTLPDFIGEFTNLTVLKLNDNLFEGNIPNLTSLTLFDSTGLNLNNNNFSIEVTQDQSDYIDLKSSSYEDWKTTQNLREDISPAIITYLLN